VELLPDARRSASPWTNVRAFAFPDNATKLVRMDEDAIRTLVTRLSRADASGGGTIERAAILAEGSDLGAVVDWITAHGGEPEAAVTAAASRRGLHSSLSSSDRTPESTPLRYVLPAGWRG
jgi:hypothetical protein